MNEEYFHKIREVSKEFAKAKAMRVRCENMRKMVKAKLMNRAKDEGVKTVSSQENYAYTHKDYYTIIEQLTEAVEKESTNWWLLRSYEIEMEYWRTNQANIRAEMQLH